MNLSHLNTFYHVARLASFSETADYLDVSKGRVSRHIKTLETDMNVQLFFRTTRVVNLTEAGKQLFTYAESIMLMASDAEQMLSDKTYGDSGVLRFTAPINLGGLIIGDILPEFLAQCPNVELELNFSNNMQDIEHGEQDIALRAYKGELPHNSVAKHLGAVKNVFVASPDYLENQSNIRLPSELSGHKCLLLQNHSRKWSFTQNNQNQNQNQNQYIDVSGSISAIDYGTIRQLAIAGMGVANIPLFYVTNEIALGKLIQLLPEHHSVMYKLAVLHAKHRKLPKKIHVFKELLTAWSQKNYTYFTKCELTQ